MSESSFLHAIAGAVAGAGSLAITYPLYSRMIRQQIQEHQESSSQVLSEHADKGSLSQLLSAIRSLQAKQNLDRHFAGLPAALWAVTIQSFVYYYFFAKFKQLHRVSTSPLGNMLVGTEAGVVTVLLTNPLWVINSRQITVARPSPSLAVKKESQTNSEVTLTEAECSTTDAAQPPIAVAGASFSSSSSSSSASPPTASPPSLAPRIARTASASSLGLLVSPVDEDAAVAVSVPAVTDSLTQSWSVARASASPNTRSELKSFSPIAEISPPTSSSTGGNESATLPRPRPSVEASAVATSSSATLSLANASFFRALYLLITREGFSGLYSGVGPALLLVSSPALQFASYEALRKLLLRAKARIGTHASINALDIFILGAASKIIATIATYPIQTTKTMLQRDGSLYSQMGTLRGITQCIRDLLHSEEGVLSFYRGVNAKLVQTAATAALLFVLREKLIVLLMAWSARRTRV